MSGSPASRVLLKTKLRPAYQAARLLPRHHLLDPTQVEAQRLVLIHAPAGAGKSSLLSSLVHARSEPTAWYSLSEGDSDPGLFLAYLMEALAIAYPAAFPSSRPETGWADDWKQPTSQILNEILEHVQPVVVVLDDYHLVHRQAFIQEFMEFVLRHSPDNLTMVVATRELPELPLAYLRSKGRLLELCPHELRFTGPEVQEFFEEQWGTSLDSDMVKLLLERTEGWATALQLIAQATSGRPLQQRRAYIESLESRSFVYDYLASEVFSQQPEPIRSFLKSTCVPESFCPSLAQTMSGAPPEEMLRQLEQSRLFLIRLDRAEEEQWYRYHHLFRDFLILTLEREEGRARLLELHERAAAWFEAQGDALTSAGHYLAAGKLDRVGEHLEASGAPLLLKGMHGTLEGWLNRLPNELLERPGLLVLRGELSDFQGDWTRAVEFYQAALDRYRAAQDHPRVAEVLEKLSLCLTKYGETERLLATCAQGLETCSDPALRAMLLTWQAAALIMSGKDWDQGYHSAELAYTLAHKEGDARALSWASMAYGFIYHFPKGNFGPSLSVLSEAIDYFTRLGWPVVVHQLLMNKALVQVVQGQLEPALELIQETIQEAQGTGAHWLAKGMECLQAWALAERRRPAETRAVLEGISQTHVPGQIRPMVHRNWMSLHILEGNLVQAELAGNEMIRALGPSVGGLYSLECLASLAYLYFRQGNLDKAEFEAQQSLAAARRAGARFWEMKSLAVLATLYQERQAAQLHQALPLVLELTAEHHFEHWWLADPWQITIPLLTWAKALGLHPQLVGTLLGETEPLIAPLLPLVRSPDRSLNSQVLRLTRRLGLSSLAEDLDQIREAEPRVRRAIATMQRQQLPAVRRVRVQAFGKLEILVGGTPLLPHPRAKPLVLRLLKYFLAHPREEVSGDELLEIFWPDLSLEKGRRSLNTHISAIRRLFGRSLIEHIFPQRFRLCLDSESYFDVMEFEDQAQLGLSGGAEAEASLARAEWLYQGQFLPSDWTDNWVNLRRYELHSKYEQVLEALADLNLQAGRPAEALLRYRKLLAGDDQRESHLKKAVRCLFLLGQRAAAQEELENFCRRRGNGTQPVETRLERLRQEIFAS